jgi:outer membrane receptor for monomeric catechols
VASGEEQITGGRAELRYKLTETFTLAGRGVHMQALTTESPALGPEVGNQLTRLPRDTATVQLRYSPKGGQGFNWGTGLNYIGSYVASYEDAKHAYLAYPGYALLTLNTGYAWKVGARQFSVGLNLRNALNRDLLASNARVGAERELGCNVRLTF